MEVLLRRWWTKKYQLPWTHELFQESQSHELLIEFYEDLFENDPRAMLEAARDEEGEVVFEETGDPLIDKWEKELAQGITPDLTEGMSPVVLAKLNKKSAQQKRAKQLMNELEAPDGLVDPSQLTKYASKLAQVGGKEDIELLGQKKSGRYMDVDYKKFLGSDD